MSSLFSSSRSGFSRRRLPVCALSLVAAFAVDPSPTFAQQLPQDPALVTGQIDNGMHYVVRKCSLPPGRAVMWVHMHTGSLNETDRQRGIAHYLEHMAFNGSENFKPGSLIPYFESMGMTFGRDQNAFTSYEQTTFQLSLPKADADTLGKGMMFFSDVVGRLSLLPSEVDAERQIIQEERRRGLSPRQRVSDYLDPLLYPGSLYGVRDAIGTEQTIDNVNQQDFKDYYGKWYGASNATLIVIADADPQEVIKLVKDKFSALPKRPQPKWQELNVKPYAKSFALVATDPEINTEDVRIARLEPARPATLTEKQYRDDLVASIGTSVLNRRLSEKAASGDTAYRNARVALGNRANAIYTAEISGSANAGKWRETLNEIALELQRGRAFGFTQREIDVVKKERISGAERAVETAATTQMSGYVSRINNNLVTGEPTMSPEQELALLQKYLPTITPEEVSKRFALEFDPKAVAFVATLPPKDAPTDAQLLELGLAALAVTPTPETETTHATTLLAEMPAPGKVVEGSEHATTKVWNGWLSNNINVHYRFMDARENEVSIRIALIGGELLETADNRGITSAAQLAWSRAATQHLSSTDIRELMAGKKVNVGGGGFGGGRGGGGGRGRGGGGGGGGADSISLSISGSPEDLETGFQLAYLLLTEPKIEAPAFTQFQATAREGYEMLMKNPSGLGARTVAALTYPDDPRVQPTTPEQIERLKLEDAQKWLEQLIAHSPIEVTIVGDLPRDQALDLCARYIGALPSRDRVDPAMFDSLRHLKRPEGPRIANKVIETPTEQAYVFSGFYGVDENDRDESRLMSMAARILSMRMVSEVREKEQLVYSIGAGSRAASTYPGFGSFSASAPTDPPKVEALVAKLASMYQQFAKEGPTEDEITVAKRQMATTWVEQIKEPQFWAGRLNMMTFRGVHLDDILTEPDSYQSMTAKDVHEAFAKYYSPQNAIVVTVKPASESGGK